MKPILLVFICLLSLSVKSQIITTIAGQGTSFADGIPATTAKFSNVSYTIFDKIGNLYFSNGSDHKIRKIDTSGIVTTIAGIGVGSGLSGDGGPATAAKLNQPFGMAIDTVGNIFFADGANHRIRKIDKSTGLISTVIGNISGFSGDGGMASAAQLKLPCELWFDKKGNLFINDAGNLRVRKVNKLGIITTVAGNGLSGWDGNGGPATAARCFPWGGVCTDDIGNIFFAELSYGVVRKVDTAGIISTIAGDTTTPHYYNGDNIPATNARIDPVSIYLDVNGELYISDYINNRIRKVGVDGIIKTVAGTGENISDGDGGLAIFAKVSRPCGLTIDTCSNLYFGQVTNPRIRKIEFNPDCIPTSVKDENTNHNVSVQLYPNPTNREVTIEGKAISNVTVRNMMGQVVFEQAYKKSDKVMVNISHLPPGIYMVRVNDLWVGKVVKE
jgi:hypothetical protein